MTHSFGLSCIFIVAASSLGFLAIRHLNDPDRRRFRWQYASGLFRDAGIAVLFALLATFYARSVPTAVEAALLGALLVACFFLPVTFHGARAK